MSLPPIDYQTFIAVSPMRVFDTLTNAAGWDAWFTHGTELDAQPGAKIRLVWRKWGPEHISTEDGGTILEVIPGQRFVFTWQPDQQPTTVYFELIPHGTGTIVHLTDSGYSTPEVYMDCAAGWGEALTLLKFYLEHGVTYGEVPEIKVEY
jgi:uncharacterized protein YndB with AHSA1/START domain